MFVDVQITSGLDRQIKQTVMGNMVQHVVVKPHTSTDFNLPAAIDLQPYQHIGLFGHAVYFCCSRHLSLLELKRQNAKLKKELIRNSAQFYF